MSLISARTQSALTISEQQREGRTWWAISGVTRGATILSSVSAADIPTNVDGFTAGSIRATGFAGEVLSCYLRKCNVNGWYPKRNSRYEYILKRYKKVPTRPKFFWYLLTAFFALGFFVSAGADQVSQALFPMALFGKIAGGFIWGIVRGNKDVDDALAEAEKKTSRVPKILRTIP
jgi:hypothetical protein